MNSSQNTSKTINNNDTRLQALLAWLTTYAAQYQIDLTQIRPASSDASFRRYFRAPTPDGDLIIMDAPPPQENCGPFVHVTQLLAQAKVNVPIIYEQDLTQGFLLLNDLGQKTYFQRLHEAPSDAEIHQLYLDAIDAMIAMQHSSTEGLPVYTHETLLNELQLFPEWYVNQHHQTELTEKQNQQLQSCFDTLVSFNLKQASVFVHRDFHSPNIMVCEGNLPNPGVIDYQDAVVGPITYDVASLLFDARFTWDEAQQLDWAIRYWEKAKASGLPVDQDFNQFHQAYEWMGLQRNLRILGVFARLNHRDGKAHYLDHIPRVNQYVRQVAQRYDVFLPLIHILDQLDQVEHHFTF